MHVTKKSDGQAVLQLQLLANSTAIERHSVGVRWAVWRAHHAAPEVPCRGCSSVETKHYRQQCHPSLSGIDKKLPTEIYVTIA